MALVVVGGHTRNIGKTSVVAGLIAALPEFDWTAIKITQYGHGICSADGEACDCATADHSIAVSEERQRASGTDSSRYLAAGARHSWWVRTQQGELHQAMPRVRKLIESAEHIIVESNSILRFLRPDLALSVLDPAVTDFKASALSYLDRMDALVMPVSEEIRPAWHGVSASLLSRTRQFRFAAPEYVTQDLAEFVRSRLQHAERSGSRN